MAKRRPKGAGAARKLPSGRWQAKIKVGDQYHAAPVTFDAKVDADAWLAAQARDLAAGTWTPPQPAAPKVEIPTLREYAEGWLAGRELKPTTRRDYRSLLDRHILPDLGGHRMDAVTPTLVRSWYGKVAPGKATLRSHAYGLLRTIYATAVTDDVVSVQPCRIRGAGSAKRGSTTTIATVAEVEAIAKAMPPRLSCMVWLAAWAGLRYGELVELRRGDIDLGRGVVRVRRSATRIGGKAHIGTPKSAAGVRDVTLPPHVVPLVAGHLERHTGAQPGDLLFPSDYGDTLPPSTFYGWFHPAREKAGRTDLRFHDLRHTQATLAAASGATLRELMQRLGHSTPGAALRYQQLAGDRDRVIAEALSGLAAGGGEVVPLRPRDAG